MADTTASNLAKKFEFLEGRAQRKPQSAQGSAELSANHIKANIQNLKDFYLERLAKRQPEVAARLGAQANRFLGSETAQPEASGQHFANRPGFVPPAGAAKSTKGTYGFVVPKATPAPQPVDNNVRGKSFEVMCNLCFMLIPIKEAPTHGAVCCRGKGRSQARKSEPLSPHDVKLHKIRAALETRLEETASKVIVMRHLTQLRYHIDAALKWHPGSPEIGGLSEHTVEQVKELTSSARVLAPAVYIFSKRIESIVRSKEKDMRRERVLGEEAASRNDDIRFERGNAEFEKGVRPESVVGARSIVSEMDSDCGTGYSETVLTQDGPNMQSDVGNVNDANEYLNLKNEDEQRRWFYSQCLTVKLACPDKLLAKRMLISDLYTKVRAEKVPIQHWVKWIRAQLIPEESGNDAATPTAERAPARFDPQRKP